MSALTNVTKLHPGNGVEFRMVDDGGLLVNLETGSCFRLDNVGTDLWRHLTAGQPIGEAIDSMRTRYDADPEVIAADALRLCNDLLAVGLLRTDIREGTVDRS